MGKDAVAAITVVLAADPVSNTVLGSALEVGGASLWCALHPDDATVLAVRSQPEYPIVLTAGWTAADAALLGEALNTLPELTGVTGPASAVDGVAGALADRTGRSVRHRRNERLFRLDNLDPPTGVDGSARLAAADDGDVLHEWITAFAVEAHAGARDPARFVAQLLAAPGRAWLWMTDDGTPVALAARRPVAYASARVGPVYTPPARRGRGYGSAVTARATQAILDEGAVPVLFTDLANPVSNAIYQRMGYRPVRDQARVMFE